MSTDNFASLGVEVYPIGISSVIDQLTLKGWICFGDGRSGSDMVIVACLDNACHKIFKPDGPPKRIRRRLESRNDVRNIQIRDFSSIVGLFRSVTCMSDWRIER